MAEGDLTHEVTPVTPLIEDDSKDELGQVARSVDTIRNGIVATVMAYNATAESLSTLVGSVAEQRRRPVGRVGGDGVVLRGGRPRRRRDRLGRQRRRAGRRAPGALGRAGEGRDRGGRRGHRASAESAQETADAAAQARQVAHEGEQAVAAGHRGDAPGARVVGRR